MWPVDGRAVVVEGVLGAVESWAPNLALQLTGKNVDKLLNYSEPLFALS